MAGFLKQGLWKFAVAAITVPVATGIIAPYAQAQFSDSYNFLKLVRERKGAEVEEKLNEAGTVIINTRDVSTGQNALHIVIDRRDSEWLGYLLAKGANPNQPDKKGVTPLMLATQLGFVDGVNWLVGDRGQTKTVIDATNRSGETALILAVHARNQEMVRLLLNAGGNPDKKDSVAGYSARDYAAKDGRGNAILAIIEAKKPADGKPAKGLDFSGVK